MAKDFELDDLVWAKMKGFPPWPARISEPPEGNTAKSKKAQHFVYFFGTHDVAWIMDELIFHHSEQMLMNSNNYKKKSTTLQAAIDELKEECLKAPPKPSTEKSKKETPRAESPKSDIIPDTPKTSKKGTATEKSLEIDSTPSTSKTPKKVVLKKKIEKKRPKKRPAPADDQVLDTSKDDDDYSLLIANVPPNNALNSNIAIIPPYDSLTNLETNFTNPYSFIAGFDKKPKKNLPPNKKKLGFIGLGAMGSQMVRHLLKSKHNVTVWNRTIEKCNEFVSLGARKSDTPADLVRMCDIIFCCVSDPDAVKAIFFSKSGVLEGFAGGGSSTDMGNKSYVEMTSLDPTTAQEVGEAVCGEGGMYLEAPMIGSRQQLMDGQILIITAGDRSLFTECDTCFNVWSRNAFYFNSAVGTASQMNLLVSMVVGTTYATLAEGLALMERCSMQPKRLMDVIKEGPLNCPLVMEKGNAMLEKNPVVDRPVKHLQKDLDLALSLSNNYDQPLILTAAVNETFKRAKRDFAEKDVSFIYKSSKLEYMS